MARGRIDTNFARFQLLGREGDSLFSRVSPVATRSEQIINNTNGRGRIEGEVRQKVCVVMVPRPLPRCSARTVCEAMRRTFVLKSVTKHDMGQQLAHTLESPVQ
jgi:hypothetical protein